MQTIGKKNQVDSKRLATELRRNIQGEVRFDDGNRALYSTDASNYRQVPIGVVVPRSKQDMIATIELCRRYGAPVTARGGGTSLAGQCCNTAVIVDSSKYLRRIVELDPARKIARVEPGVVLDQLRNAAKPHHLTFGCDTSTHEYATMGGSIGNNACGVHSVMAGRTSDNIHELEIITHDGCHLRVGATTDEEFSRIIPKEGGARKFTPICDELRMRMRIKSAQGSRRFRGVSPGTISMIFFRRMGSMWRGRWWGLRGLASITLKRPCV
jgi:FAD/FMN-containing dehydrogenase